MTELVDSHAYNVLRKFSIPGQCRNRILLMRSAISATPAIVHFCQITGILYGEFYWLVKQSIATCRQLAEQLTTTGASVAMFKFVWHCHILFS